MMPQSILARVLPGCYRGDASRRGRSVVRARPRRCDPRIRRGRRCHRQILHGIDAEAAAGRQPRCSRTHGQRDLRSRRTGRASRARSGAIGPREASAAAACSAAATPSGPSSVEARYTSAPEARTSVAAASRPAMPPQREIFRQTASATPAASAPGSAAVSSMATRTATRSRTSRTPSRPCVGSSTSSRPGGRERLDRRTASSDVPRAVRVEPQRHRAGPRAARAAATRPASSPTPTFSFRHPKPSARGARRLLGRARRGRAP